MTFEWKQMNADKRYNRLMDRSGFEPEASTMPR